MTDANKKMEGVRREIVELFAERDLTMPEAVATLAILLAQLTVFQGVSKDSLISGMGITYDEIHKQQTEEQTCH